MRDSRRRSSADRPQDHERERQRGRRRRGPEDPRRHLRAPDRVLDERVAQHREPEGAQEEEQLHAGREIVPGVLDGDRQHGPVPEVEGVRAVADEPERRGGKQPRRAVRRDDERGAGGRQERRVARERRRTGAA